jgi:predicted transcriptional regulator
MGWGAVWAMTLNIELPEELASRLAAAGIRSDEASRYALAALTEVVDHAEMRAWWDDLSAEERLKEAAKTRESLAAADAGRCRPAAEVYARVRAHAAPKARE